MNKKELNKKLRKDLEDSELLKDLLGITFGIGDTFYPVNKDILKRVLNEMIKNDPND
jgi:hypothetical protein